MGGKLATVLPEKMGEKGLDVVAKVVFLKDNFLVIGMSVVHVHLDKIIAMKFGEEKAAKFQQILAHKLVPRVFVETCIEKYFMSFLVETIMRSVMADKIEDTAREKGAELDVSVMTDAEQASEFFDILGELDGEEHHHSGEDIHEGHSHAIPTTSRGVSSSDSSSVNVDGKKKL